MQGTGGILPTLKKFMVLLYIKNFSCHVTLLLKRKTQRGGHKWVKCGSHLDCFVGHWVKWVNRYDPLSALHYMLDKNYYWTAMLHCDQTISADCVYIMASNYVIMQFF